MRKHELGQNYSEIFLKSYAHCVTYNLIFSICKLQLNNHNILCNFEYSPSCPFENDCINPIFKREEWFKRERNESERWLRAVGSNMCLYFSICFHHNNCSNLFLKMRFLREESSRSPVSTIVPLQMDYFVVLW